MSVDSESREIYHRFHGVWAIKYRYKVFQDPMRERILEIIIQTCVEMDVQIVKGVLGLDHMFLSAPPKLSLSNVMQNIKGRSSRRIQIEFPELSQHYWGRQFWARGYFSAISGNGTDDITTQYPEFHFSK